MPLLQFVFNQLGVPGLVGMGLGLWLFSSATGPNGRNIFDQQPWHPMAAAAVGGFVFGIAGWFLIAICIYTLPKVN